MSIYVGVDVSQETTTLCIVDGYGHRLWRGECTSSPQQIAHDVLQHAGADARTGIETGPMTPWFVHGLRSARSRVGATAGAGVVLSLVDRSAGQTPVEARMLVQPIQAMPTPDSAPQNAQMTA
ncbi:MAG: hypothetical protein ACLPWG_01370, partial [Steroidobacteraceae bacterium]